MCAHLKGSGAEVVPVTTVLDLLRELGYQGR